MYGLIMFYQAFKRDMAATKPFFKVCVYGTPEALFGIIVVQSRRLACIINTVHLLGHVMCSV